MRKLLLSLSVLVIAFTSCESYKSKKEAKQLAKNFFTYLKQSEQQKIAELYSGAENFGSIYKSDTAVITSASYKDGITTVWANNKFTNGFGAKFERDIALFMKRSDDGKLYIYDSKGLTDFSEEDNDKFGCKTGCITKVDTSDQQIIVGIDRAKKLMLREGVLIYMELKSNVKVTSWKWESNYYSDGASGHGIVKNNSSYRVPNLKYKVTYKDYGGNDITSDKGYVSYDALEPGQSTSFSFYTSYVGNAQRASIELEFDEDLIMEYLAKKEWDGNEWQQYVSENRENKSNENQL